jgi:hypothetical protein
MDTSWVDSNGYRPVRIDVQSLAGPVKADRVLSVTFRAIQSYTVRTSVEVKQVIEIPAGGTSATATLAVPQLCDWGWIELNTFEDGLKVDQLSTPANSIGISWSGTSKGDAASPVMMLLGCADRLSAGFLTVNNSSEIICVANPDSAKDPVDPQILNAITIPPSAVVRHITLNQQLPAALPTKWIDYTGLDMTITSVEMLETLARRYPAQQGAICDWLHNGGTLVVYGVGANWEHVEQLDRLLGVSDANQAEATQSDTERKTPADADLLKRGWIAPPNATDANASPLNSLRNALQNAPTIADAPFITRKCGLGLVTAIRSEDNFTGDNFNWTWLYQTIGSQRWQWYQRWGVSLNQPNGDFYSFLIPGVGLAPVMQFQFLITLFVLAIGPLNYYLLRRWGKLNLTVLTVPLGALAVSGALLLYALIADGLSVRVRARSITQIDQRTGQAECWSRISYYAGLSPSGGLQFSENTAVIPLLAQPGAMENESPRVLNWARTDPSNSMAPLSQKLTEGWLNTRTPTQFITARVRKTTARLEIKPAANGKPLSVTNHLGTPIQWLLVIDEDSKCHIAEKMAPDSAASLAPIASQDAACLQGWQPRLSENQPQSLNLGGGVHSLFGLARSAQSNQPSGQNNYGQNYNYGTPAQPTSSSGLPLPTQSTGILERELQEITERMLKDELPPKTYVAVVECSPEFQFGAASARQEASLHVIEGQW